MKLALVAVINSNDYASLWENIRKKKKREGKNYRPSKPGDSDRPDPPKSLGKKLKGITLEATLSITHKTL